MQRTPIRVRLQSAQSRLRRLAPPEARAAQQVGAALIDVRTPEQRVAGGAVPGAVPVALNVLEWRLDPDEPDALSFAGDFARRLVVICEEGYCSSLAAERLLGLGYARATDVVGGFLAWRAHGLPVHASGFAGGAGGPRLPASPAT